MGDGDYLNADHVRPMHHSTFRLSHEPVGEPIARMTAAGSDSARIVVREVGGKWSAN